MWINTTSKYLTPSEFIRTNYLFFIGFLLDASLFLLFTIWGLYDLIAWSDIYIPWFLILNTIVIGLHIPNIFILRKKWISKKEYVTGVSCSCCAILTVFGIISTCLTLIQYVRRRSYFTKTNLFSWYIFPPIAFFIMLTPFVYLATPSHLESWHTNQDTLKYTDNNGIEKEIRPDNWMGALPDGTRIADVSIPYTHDSLSYRVEEQPWYIHPETGNLNQGWAQTNGYSLEEQLNRGIRMFDLRFAYVYDNNPNPWHASTNPGTYYAMHSFSWLLDEDGNKLSCEKVYTIICQWLDEHPTELLFLKSSNCTAQFDANGDQKEAPSSVQTIQNYLFSLQTNGYRFSTKNHSNSAKFQDFISTSYEATFDTNVRGKFFLNWGDVQYTDDPEDIFIDHDWNTQMWDIDLKWEIIKKNLETARHLDFGNLAFDENISMTGWDIQNMRNNPMKAAKVLNNRIIGLLTPKTIQYTSDLTQTDYIGHIMLDTAPGDLEPNHNIAAAIYMLNFLHHDHN